ncbi:MAG: neutral/alkaline non-lysosomal ceramidase N-terminal domain-containing protein [Cyclobacteriaceae bacterium]
MLNKLLILMLVALSANIAFAQENSGTRFRAAVVKVNITPDNAQWLRGYNPRQSTEVLDSLYHRIVALDDGTTQFFLISSDIVGMPSAEYKRVTSVLWKRFRINPLNVWWSATHTHSAPEIGPQFRGIPYPSMANRSQLAAQHEIDTVYTAVLEKKLIDGIIAARNELAPATLGVGWGFSQANINRRAIDIDGKASLGLNPDGEVDRRIGLLRIDKPNGEPLVLIANYAIHGTVLGGESTKISGDAPGVVSEYVQKKIGAPVLFINGAAGNLAPIYSVYANERAGHLRQFSVLLGDKILEASRNISATRASVKLTIGSITVETPRRPGLGWSNDLADYTRTTNTGINLVKLPIGFLKIDEDVAIWSAPVEMFCDISNKIRNRSPFPYTFYFGYTNGSLGYLPAAYAWKEEGYEPSVSPFTPAVDNDLTEAVLGYLQGELK